MIKKTLNIAVVIICAGLGFLASQYFLQNGLDRFVGKWSKTGDPAIKMEITRSGDVFNIHYDPPQNRGMPQDVTARATQYLNGPADDEIAAESSYGARMGGRTIYRVHGSKKLYDGSTGWNYDKQ